MELGRQTKRSSFDVAQVKDGERCFRVTVMPFGVLRGVSPFKTRVEKLENKSNNCLLKSICCNAVMMLR